MAASASSASASQRAVLVDLQKYRQLSENLFAALRTGRPEAQALVEELVDVEDRMHGAVGMLLAEHEQSFRASQAEGAAAERLTALLRLATQRQRAEARLEAAIKSSHEALAATASDVNRPLSVPQVVACAEQVSYSTAAPCGQNVLDSAAKGGFRGGWGTPAPQQHMVRASVFAALHRQYGSASPDEAAAATGRDDAAHSSTEPGESAAAAQPEVRPAAAPAFDSGGLALAARNVVAAQPQAPPGSQPNTSAVSLDLLDDDD